MILPELLNSYMSEKRMDDLALAHKCRISPIKIVNIRNGSHTYSQQLVENLGRGLELNSDKIKGLLSVAEF